MNITFKKVNKKYLKVYKVYVDGQWIGNVNGTQYGKWFYDSNFAEYDTRKEATKALIDSEII